MTYERLAEIEAAEANAPQGPFVWKTYPQFDKDKRTWLAGKGGSFGVMLARGYNGPAYVTFALNALPELLAEVKRLRALIAAAYPALSERAEVDDLTTEQWDAMHAIAEAIP